MLRLKTKHHLSLSPDFCRGFLSQAVYRPQPSGFSECLGVLVDMSVDIRLSPTKFRLLPTDIRLLPTANRLLPTKSLVSTLIQKEIFTLKTY